MRRTCRVVLVACSVSAEHIGGEPTASAAERKTRNRNVGVSGTTKGLVWFRFQGLFAHPLVDLADMCARSALWSGVEGWSAHAMR